MLHRTLRPLFGPTRAGSLRFTSLPHRGYVGGPAGPACTVSGCLEKALCDSVRPAFSQVPPHSSKGLCGEITVLLARDVMEPVPPADMKTGFFSPYFIVPKKGGGWRPILDLRVLNWASFRSRDSRRSASSGASIPEIGLQRLT